MTRRSIRHLRTLATMAAVLLGSGLSPLMAATLPPMGTAANFSVLGGSEVANTGSSNVVGELGVFPGAAVNGFPPGTVFSGTIHLADAVAQQAQSDLTAAYLDAAGQTSDLDMSGLDLGGRVLTAGVYTFTSSAQLTGTLTLDAEGDANAVFIFQVGTTLTTASSARVNVINGGSDCNVFWQVGSSATLGTGTRFAGNILALTAITLTTGATVSGRVLARNARVTLDSNNIAACQSCNATTLAPATLPNATVNAAYSQALVANGATAPYTFAVTGGALPAGLSLSSAGLLSGTPTTTGTSAFTVTATDSVGCFGAQAYSIVVNGAGCPAITLAPASLPAGTVSTGYSQVISASGGTAPYTLAVTSGALPPGLALSSAGVLSGTPTAQGNFGFAVTATDAAACGGSAPYTLVITSNGGSNGDPHMRTLDGLGYEFQACGDYILTGTESRTFEVQVRQTPWANGVASVNTAVGIKVGAQRITIAPFEAGCALAAEFPDGCVTVDGQPAPLRCAAGDDQPGCRRSLALEGGGTITERRMAGRTAFSLPPPRTQNSCLVNYTVALPTGERVEACVRGGYVDIQVDVPARAGDRTVGLLGNGDGDPSNDLEVRGEGPLSLSPAPYFEEFYGSFAQSWRVLPGESLFATEADSQVQCPTHVFSLAEIPAGKREHAEELCRYTGIAPTLQAACAMDVSLMGDAAVAGFVGLRAPTVVLTLRNRDASVNGKSVDDVTVRSGCGGCSGSGTETGLWGLLVGLALLGRRLRSR